MSTGEGARLPLAGGLQADRNRDPRKDSRAPGTPWPISEAAPGGWAQALAERVGRADASSQSIFWKLRRLPGVTVVRGDFREETVLQRLEDALDVRKLDLVVSDMAPNLSAVRATDQARSVTWCKLMRSRTALSYAQMRFRA